MPLASRDIVELFADGYAAMILRAGAMAFAVDTPMPTARVTRHHATILMRHAACACRLLSP